MTFTFDGVTYDLSKQYIDAHGDDWEFSPIREDNGMPRMNCFWDTNYAGVPLSTVVRLFGPLREA